MTLVEQSGDPGPSSMANRALGIPTKVSQIDSDDLDEALVDMIGERVQRSLGNFGVGTALDWKPEVSLLLKLVIFRWGVYDPLRLSSPGASLQNLRLTGSANSRPSRQRLLLYLLLHPPIFPTYILTRLRSYGLSKQWPDLPARDWRRRAWKAIIAMESFAKMWELAGWTAFLVDPRYPSLLMRILELRLVPTSPHLTRLISYEFSNRQLVWSAFTEFLMFAVPLAPTLPAFLNPKRHLAALQTLLTRPKTVDYTSIPTLASRTFPQNEKPSRDSHSGPFADLPLTSCPICHQRRQTTPKPIGDSASAAEIALPPVEVSGGEDEEKIFVPAETDCWGGCRWCYYCIAGELARHAEVHAAEVDKASGKVQEGNTENKGQADAQRSQGRVVKWDCLRCGGGVTRAWRVGSESRPEEEGDMSDSVSSVSTGSVGSSVVVIE